MVNKTCLICNSNPHSPIFNNLLLKCTSCGLVTANIEVNEEVIKRTYTEKYFIGEEYSDYLKDKTVLQNNFRKRLKYILRKINKNDIKHAIEIGCAYCFFAEVIHQELQDIDYTGFDVVKSAIDFGKEKLMQNLICGDFLEMPINENIRIYLCGM